MKLTKQEILERLLNAYSHEYDIVRDVQVEGGSFPATAFFFLRDEHYVVFKSKKYYATEQFDYTYFYLTDHLTRELAQEQMDLCLKAGLSNIKPNSEHQASFVTLIILADVIDPEAKKCIKRTRFHKNFRLTFHGWMEFHVAAMEVSTMSFLSNPAGRMARKTLEQNFAPGKK